MVTQAPPPKGQTRLVAAHLVIMLPGGGYGTLGPALRLPRLAVEETGAEVAEVGVPGAPCTSWPGRALAGASGRRVQSGRFVPVSIGPRPGHFVGVGSYWPVARVVSKWSFAHGDITARNVLRDSEALALIDWEWAGLFPVDYDLAFLWFLLAGVPSGRAKVEAVVPAHAETGFLLSAVLVHLLHLQLWLRTPNPFISQHKETLRQLLTGVAGPRTVRSVAADCASAPGP